MVCPSCGRLVGVGEKACPHCGRSNPGMWGFTRMFQNLGQVVGPVELIIGACVLIYVVSLLIDPAGVVLINGWSVLQPSTRSVLILGASGTVPVFEANRFWTVLSASWLHGNLIHILFNMMWIRQLAPATAKLYGVGRMLLIYVVSGTAGFVLSTLSGHQLTLGASAAVFGLLGALVVYGRRTGNKALGQQIWMWAVMLFVLGLVMRGVDNFAHLGGFLGGYGMARWLDPLREETSDHLISGLIAVGVSLLAVVASVVGALVLF